MILLVLSFVLPFVPVSVGDVRAWTGFLATCVAVGRPLLSRIVVPGFPGASFELSYPGQDSTTFSDVTALFAWRRHLGVCDSGGITIVRPRAMWTVRQLDRLAATLGVPLTVHRDGTPKAATGSQIMADLMVDQAAIAGADVVVHDLGKHKADVSRLVRILSDALPGDAGTLPRVRLRHASGDEVAKAAAALLDAGALIRIERLSALR